MLIDYKKLLINTDLAVIELWTRFFDTLLVNLKEFKNYIIFAHNLGSFDGFILFKGLINISKPDEISTIIDK